MKRATSVMKNAVRAAKARRKQRTPFPYAKVARMWDSGKTIKTIANSIGLIDRDNKKDPYHSLRNFLYRMHKGYKNGNGEIVKLPHRVPQSTVRAARKVGKKGPIAVRRNKRAAALAA
jgi:hypothetical protein